MNEQMPPAVTGPLETTVRQHFTRTNMQTKPYSLTQYLAAGCETLTRNGRLDAIGAGIHGATGGKPCNGCHANKGCAALAKLRAMDGTTLRSVMPAPETVREEAARRGLSIGEVRRQRQAAVGAA